MLRRGSTLFSAGDRVAFLECEPAATLALQDLATPLEAAFLESLKGKGLRIAERPSDGAPAAFAAQT